MSEQVLANKSNKQKNGRNSQRNKWEFGYMKLKVTRAKTNSAKKYYVSEKFRFPPSEAATFNADDENQTKER